ncbi:MAG TPA: hypothetical protein VJ749_09580 [Pyrinomonadaceae bacterium]|jgi:hypothetical protein|nr:hypothetical protein [Pyrinomonadaceae bacterium]
MPAGILAVIEWVPPKIKTRCRFVSAAGFGIVFALRLSWFVSACNTIAARHRFGGDASNHDGRERS